MKNLLRNVAYASIIVAATAFTVHQLNEPAQAGSQTIVGFYASSAPCGGVFMTSNGDVYQYVVAAGGGCGSATPETNYLGNVWQNPINVEPSTWSQIKARDWKPGN